MPGGAAGACAVTFRTRGGRQRLSTWLERGVLPRGRTQAAARTCTTGGGAHVPKYPDPDRRLGAGGKRRYPWIGAGEIGRREGDGDHRRGAVQRVWRAGIAAPADDGSLHAI